MVAAVLEAAMATPSTTPRERRSRTGGPSGAVVRSGTSEDIGLLTGRERDGEEEPCGGAMDGTPGAHFASMLLT
ncbi:hypothetical protein GCM10010515_61040 [Streptomyces fructofermentans]|uniref:Uncharacterized protein n=1 Tax=Streptomyces fructofermentans TaxID=152141 RepID=A0A918NPH1_9ACTN|nr:hypothetical protein GCM10010515_61040 [Streptomyces fructofermentans]